MATVSVRVKHLSGGWQQVLNGGGTLSLLNSAADATVARSGGQAYKRGFTATRFSYGPRPAVTVFAKRHKNPILQHMANHRLEGAM